MKIKTIRNIYEKYEVELSTDDTKNLNFIIDGTSTGQTLYYKLQSYFMHGRDGRMEIDLIDERNCDLRFMFVDEYPDYHELLDYFVGMKFTGEFSEISKDANDIFNKMILEHGDGGLDFLKMEDNHIMIPKSLSTAKSTTAYYALLVAIIRRYRINQPVIINDFGRWGLKYGPLILELLSKNVPQVLIFTSDGKFSRPTRNYRTKKDIPSMYDIIKDSTLGRAHCLTDDGATKYVPF